VKIKKKTRRKEMCKSKNDHKISGTYGICKNCGTFNLKTGDQETQVMPDKETFKQFSHCPNCNKKNEEESQ
jgi:hypothetical protein